MTHLGYYTQNVFKELVACAKLRKVEIIQEMDMSGHGMSIIEA